MKENEEGISLLEMLISLSIISVIMLAISQFLLAGIRSQNVLIEKSYSTEQFMQTKLFLKDMFQKSIKPKDLHIGSRNKISKLLNDINFKGDFQSIQFLGKFVGTIDQVGLYQFSLLKKKIGENYSLIVQWTKQNSLLEAQSLNKTETVLISNIKDLKIRYFKKQIEENKQDWKEKWSSYKPPDLIHLMLYFSSKENIIRKDLYFKTN